MDSLVTRHVFKKPVFLWLSQNMFPGDTGEELGDRTWEDESATKRAMVHPSLPMWVFSFTLKKKSQICYRRKYTGRKGRKERRNPEREEGRKGEREARTKRGGKKGMRRRTFCCLPDTSWRLGVVVLTVACCSKQQAVLLQSGRASPHFLSCGPEDRPQSPALTSLTSSAEMFGAWPSHVLTVTGSPNPSVW